MKISKLILPAAIVAVIAIFSIGAQAQATRTWVSGVGDDVNPCSRTAPCKTWAGAISKTAAGGEIDALDPGGFGAVTITKSITLNGTGTMASTLASGTNGFIIIAGATDIVTLRNISINGAGSTLGTNGILINTVGQLNVESCDIRNFSTSGINFTSTAAGGLLVKDTVILSTGDGIHIDAAAGGASVSLDNVRIQSGAVGLNVVSNAIVTISNSVISHNTGSGISAANSVQVNAESVKITNNGTGISSAGTSTVRMSNLDIFGNASGLTHADTSVLASYLNNKIRGNGVDGAPTLNLGQQ